MRLTFDVDGPVPAADVHPGWPAMWWLPGKGWADRVPSADGRHHARELYVLHPCEDRRHRPPAPDAPQPEGTPTRMTAPNFGAPSVPAAGDGDQYSPKDHVGAVVLVKVRERKDGIVTSNSPNGGPGVIVDLVDLGDGNIYRDVLWMGGPFVDGLTPHVGLDPVVIRIGSQVGKSGRPYGTFTDAPDMHETARSYYAAKGDPFAQTFATATPPPAAAPAAAAPPPAPAGQAAPPPWAAGS
jgi:hypothetical protein